MTGPEPDLERYPGGEASALTGNDGWQSISRAAALLLWAVVFVVMTAMSAILMV